MRLAAQAALQQVAAQENQDALLQHHLHHHAHPLHAQQVPPHVHKYNVGMRSKAIGDQSDHLTMDGQQQQDAVPKAGGESEDESSDGTTTQRVDSGVFSTYRCDACDVCEADACVQRAPRAPRVPRKSPVRR